MISLFRRRSACALLACAAVCAALSGSALAQDPSLEQRFRGKQIRVLIGSSAVVVGGWLIVFVWGVVNRNAGEDA